MGKKTSRKRWSFEEVEKLKLYIKGKSELLMTNFYENIVEGKMKVRKPPGFFIEMAKELEMTPKQCKSKFQKSEKEIYTKYLAVSEDHYSVFISLRKKNFFAKHKINLKQNEIDAIGDSNALCNTRMLRKLGTHSKTDRNTKPHRKCSTEKNSKLKPEIRRLFSLREQIINKYLSDQVKNCSIKEGNLKSNLISDSISERIQRTDSFLQAKSPFIQSKILKVQYELREQRMQKKKINQKLKNEAVQEVPDVKWYLQNQSN
jgi:hypothetical protein